MGQGSSDHGIWNRNRSNNTLDQPGCALARKNHYVELVVDQGTSAPGGETAPGPPQDRLGRPLRSLRLSVTDRCNLRCRYCMPETDYQWLPRGELLDFDELSRLIDRFCKVGVSRVRVTGGEPLLRRGLSKLIERIAAKPAIRDLALTTNGLLLRQQATALRDAGVARLTVSLDTLRPKRFEALTRRDALAEVLAGIRAANRAGFACESGPTAPGLARLKIDTVVMQGINEDELCPLLDFAAEVSAELRFIEYMDVGGATRWSADGMVTRAAILAAIEQQLGTPTPLPGRGAAPAERFALPDGRTFGVVASMTEPFCQACDRSRLTSDGFWYQCLYAQSGIDLKTPLRGGASNRELAALIDHCWRERSDRGAEE
ncbi:MAG: GTP 3',8-cyclase MoaA, partial [Planctomycetota bacterium]